MKIALYGDSSELRITDPILTFTNKFTGHIYICDYSECGLYVASGQNLLGVKVRSLPLQRLIGEFLADPLVNPRETRVWATNNGLARFLEHNHIETLEQLIHKLGEKS